MNPGPSRVESAADWTDALTRLGLDHLLQSWEWGQFKAAYRWQPLRLLWSGADGQPAAAAQLLFRSEGPGLTMAYCPRGPLLNWSDTGLRNRVLADLAAASRKHGAFFLKIDPALIASVSPLENAPFQALEDLPAVEADFGRAGWERSSEQVQFRNTLVLDLRPDAEAILTGMKQKTRYNIRLAGRKGVTVRRGGPDDLALLYRMFAATSLRDRFAIRGPDYYQRAWGDFFERSLAQPLVAEVEGEPVAAIIVFRFQRVAYYLYGMSLEQHREKMPNYLLQWEAIRWAKECGCTLYDFWGAPDELDERDPMYGVYRFKEGFGAALVETPGAWDLPLRPVRFAFYRLVMPPVLALMRAAGRASTRGRLDSR